MVYWSRTWVPVLAPEVRYSGMAVSEGRTATNELMGLSFDSGLDPQERSIRREQLLAYCKLAPGRWSAGLSGWVSWPEDR